ncbi:MAG: bifunctional riboflavin kinase/FAD synthetase [Betaproteobacteria bacterium]|nr:bifunctional riboflavin kinase/FAD synthetase [Betaproteobacteria bacterium]
MQVFRGIGHRALAPFEGHAGGGHALTIGNFDGVHRGHQAMLALLRNEARHRGVPSCVMTFEPHPRDFFAVRAGRPETAPRRISTLRDKLAEIERCGVDRVVVMRFDAAFAALPPEDFISRVLVAGLGVRYVLVGDDFTFGARRAGTYETLDDAGRSAGFDVARMMSYEVHGLRVSSSAVREALAAGDMAQAESLLGRPYAISGHVRHGRKLGRELGFPTLNLHFGHARPAAGGIFVARVHGLTDEPLPAVASLGVRPSIEAGGRVLLEAHVFDWPAALGRDGGYGRVVDVQLLHKLHDERKYESIEALRAGIAADTQAAREWLAERAF